MSGLLKGGGRLDATPPSSERRRCSGPGHNQPSTDRVHTDFGMGTNRAPTAFTPTSAWAPTAFTPTSAWRPHTRTLRVDAQHGQVHVGTAFTSTSASPSTPRAPTKHRPRSRRPPTKAPTAFTGTFAHAPTKRWAPTSPTAPTASTPTSAWAPTAFTSTSASPSTPRAPTKHRPRSHRLRMTPSSARSRVRNTSGTVCRSPSVRADGAHRWHQPRHRPRSHRGRHRFRHGHQPSTDRVHTEAGTDHVRPRARPGVGRRRHVHTDLGMGTDRAHIDFGLRITLAGLALERGERFSPPPPTCPDRVHTDFGMDRPRSHRLRHGDLTRADPACRCAARPGARGHRVHIDFGLPQARHGQAPTAFTTATDRVHTDFGAPMAPIKAPTTFGMGTNRAPTVFTPRQLRPAPSAANAPTKHRPTSAHRRHTNRGTDHLHTDFGMGTNRAPTVHIDFGPRSPPTSACGIISASALHYPASSSKTSSSESKSM